MHYHSQIICTFAAISETNGKKRKTWYDDKINILFYTMKRLYLRILAAAMIIGSMLPQQAQGQTEEFTVATLNVDGLPDEVIGIPINPDGPGEKYTPEIADYLL